MSQLGHRQFEIQTGVKSPFLPPEPRKGKPQESRKKNYKKGIFLIVRGPSGSDWNEPHLNWLHILLEFNYELKDIFPPNSQLSQSSKIATYLRAKLKEEWGWICRSDHEESNSIYSCLKNLVRLREEDDAYNTHSNTQSSTQHLTPRSAKSDSVTPQQYPRGIQKSLGGFERTPTPLPRHKDGVNPQTHTPQMLSRKRQLEEMSPGRERGGIKDNLPHAAKTPPPYQRPEGSPTPQQPGMKPAGYQVEGPATPIRHMPPPNSPLTHRQQNSATSSRETESHLELDRPNPLRNKQSSFTRQQRLKTPNSEENVLKTDGGRKTPPQLLSEQQGVGASSTVQSQHHGLQYVTWDDEDKSDKEEDGEDDDDEDKSDKEEDGEEDDGEEDDDEEDDDEEDDDQDGSEEEEEGGGISEAAAFDKSEDDVKATGRVFLSLVRDAINNTKKGVESKKLAEQNLVFETRDPQPHGLNIDKIPMWTHPDLVLQMFFGDKGQRKTIGVVLEFKRRNHPLKPERLLAQEVSELLGAVLDKMAAFRHRNSYKSYLISWHGLKGYISRFHATREYLQQLQENSRALQELDPPTVRRSKEFNLTLAEERIDFAIACARIAVTQLQEYERNWTSGLLDRILA